MDEAKSVLHIGCGPGSKTNMPPIFHQADWREVRLDINPKVKPDIVASITDMSAVEDASMDMVFTSHMIEHLHAHEVPVAFAEMARVLKPEGAALITCPDLELAARMVLDGNLMKTVYESEAGPIAAIDIIFGYRRFIADGNTFMAHRTGFTMRSLGEALSQAGFGTVHVAKKSRNTFDIWCYATRSACDDIDRRAAPYLPFLNTNLADPRDVI